MKSFQKVLGLILFLLLPLLSAPAAEKGADSSSTNKSAVAAPTATASTASVAPASASGTASPQNAALPQAQASPSGSFQWSYPLNLPPGTNGVQPNLSLTYNSAAPNGLLGMGFSLTGLSAIERDASRGINFTATDSYVLDGQKLYRLTAANGGDGNYHAERETFDRIQAFLTSAPTTPGAEPNSANSFWVVSKKDGTKLYYGQNADSRITAVGKALPRVWALDKVEDANGNFYTISYLQDAATGAHYPLKIVYTLGNGLSTTKTVQFSYETRTDHGPLYLPTKVDLDKRLKWITVLLGTDAAGAGGTLVRKYRVDYQYSASTGRTQATAIQEYGKDGDTPVAGYVPDGYVSGDASTNLLPPTVLFWPSTGSGSFEGPLFSSNGNIGYQTTFTDINGDGKMDWVKHTADGVYVGTMLSRGDGTFEAPLFSSNGNTGYQTTFTDINGDGKMDWVKHTADGIYVGTMLSRGDGTFEGARFSSNENTGYQTTFTDINGDGKMDWVKHTADGIYVGTMLSAGFVPDVLTTITLPTGGTITATYTPAPQITSVPGVSGHIQPSLSVYPKVANSSPRPLVTQIVLDPKLPGMAPITTNYEYFNGQFLSGTSEARADLGFEQVTQIDAAGTRTTTTLSQNLPTQGMPTGTLVEGSDGKKYVETLTAYTDSPVTGAHAKVRFVSTASQITKRFDGNTTSTDTKKSFEYDTIGNLKKVTHHGILDPDGTDPLTDNVTEKYEYAFNGTNSLYRMTKKQTYSSDDAPSPAEDLASETNYYYDSLPLGSIGVGRLTRVENRIDGATTASTWMEYDGGTPAWGNVTKTTDANGVVTSQVTYDSTYHNLVVTTTDARGLTTTVTAWDNLLPAKVQDHQNNVSRVVYDVFGRKVKTVSPLPWDTPESPTTETIYTNTAPPAGTPVVIQTKEKTTGTTYLPAFTYLDALGRVVQTKTLAKVGSTSYVTVDRYYDTLGRNVAVSNPYLSSGSTFSYNAALVNNLSQRKTTFTYDAVGRVTQTSRPIDTSNTLAVTRTIYDQTKTTSVDALNHVTEVEDRGNVRFQRTYTGTYPNQVLYTTVKATNSRGKTVVEDDKDNNQTTPGNKITTVYDMLGRKTQYTDPDMGTWAYTYTANGSLLTQTDAKGNVYDGNGNLTQQNNGNGNVLSFTYDAKGRVETKKQGSTVVATYQYGTGGFQNGLLENIYLGAVTGTPYLHYTYDKLGRTLTVTKAIGTYGTKTITLAYNADGRLLSKQFPGGGETVTYDYGVEGLLNSVTGASNYLSVGLDDIDDFGRVTSQTWGNGTSTTYTFDPVTFRTTKIATPGVMELGYTFDALGQVLSKTEYTPGTQTILTKEIFTYDALDRLRTAQSTGLYGSRTYKYDPLNNLLGQYTSLLTETQAEAQANQNTYSTTKPHAVISAGSSGYTYDPNGNMSSRTIGVGGAADRNYGYDPENRLTSATVGGVTSTYTYDDTRQRTTLTVGTKTTVFWFDDYEETFTTGTQSLVDTVRSYSVNGQKVAQRTIVGGNSTLVFLYTDHLGSTSKVRDAAGNVTASYYEPFGKLHSTTINGVRESFTGQEWDGSAQLMYYNARFYDPALGRFIQPDTVLDGLNRYSYCGNNPVNFTDPSGHWFGIDDLWAAVAGAVVGAGTNAFNQLTAMAQGNQKDFNWGQFGMSTAVGAFAGWVSWNLSGGLAYPVVMSSGGLGIGVSYALPNAPSSSSSSSGGGSDSGGGSPYTDADPIGTPLSSPPIGVDPVDINSYNKELTDILFPGQSSGPDTYGGMDFLLDSATLYSMRGGKPPFANGGSMLLVDALRIDLTAMTIPARQSIFGFFNLMTSGSKTAQEVISKERKGSINQEFPSQWRDSTLDQIQRAAKNGDRSAKTAWKLLTDNRFKK